MCSLSNIYFFAEQNMKIYGSNICSFCCCCDHHYYRQDQFSHQLPGKWSAALSRWRSGFQPGLNIEHGCLQTQEMMKRGQKISKGLLLTAPLGTLRSPSKVSTRQSPAASKTFALLMEPGQLGSWRCISHLSPAEADCKTSHLSIWLSSTSFSKLLQHYTQRIWFETQPGEDRQG